MKLITAISAALDESIAEFEVRAAELRTGVTLIEAVAADVFATELRCFTTSEGEREDVRRAAIELAKAGLTAADIGPMARSWYMAENRFRLLAAEANRYAEQFSRERL